MIVSDREYSGQVRRGCSFKDGRFIRDVEIHEDNVIRFTDQEDHILHENRDLVGRDFIVQTVDAETSSFGTPHIVLTFFGFTPNAAGQGKSREIVVSTDYNVQPPEF